MKIIAAIALLLFLIGCSPEPESRYRLEKNEITGEYRIGYFGNDGWGAYRLGKFYPNGGQGMPKEVLLEELEKLINWEDERRDIVVKSEIINRAWKGVPE